MKKLIMCTQKEIEENTIFESGEALQRLPWKQTLTLRRYIQQGKLKGWVTGEGHGRRYYTTAQAIEDFWQRYLSKEI